MAPRMASLLKEHLNRSFRNKYKFASKVHREAVPGRCNRERLAGYGRAWCGYGWPEGEAECHVILKPALLQAHLPLLLWERTHQSGNLVMSLSPLCALKLLSDLHGPCPAWPKPASVFPLILQHTHTHTPAQQLMSGFLSLSKLYHLFRTHPLSCLSMAKPHAPSGSVGSKVGVTDPQPTSKHRTILQWLLFLSPILMSAPWRQAELNWWSFPSRV